MTDPYLLDRKLARKKTQLTRMGSFKKILIGLAEDKEKIQAEKELERKLKGK